MCPSCRMSRASMHLGSVESGDRTYSVQEGLLRRLLRYPELWRQLAGGVALGHRRHRDRLDLVGVAGRAELLEARAADRGHRVHRRLQILARIELTRGLGEHLAD